MRADREIPVLIEDARGGDRTAFDRLVSRLEQRIDALIASRLGPRLRLAIEPDDVKQETLLRAFRSLRTFVWTGEGSFLRWIGGIVEHVILQQEERFKVRRGSPLKGEISAGDVSPSKTMRREERFERLEEALCGLSPEHRQVILLARIERLSARQIADRMNRSPAAVAQLLSRALKRLREMFGDTASLGLPRRSFELQGGRDGQEQ